MKEEKDEKLPIKAEASESVTGKLQRALEVLISQIPDSTEPASEVPLTRARAIVGSAAIKAAATSSGLSLPPGPAGLLTILPDVVAIWHIQKQMVSDIAATFGRKAILGKEQMLYCLFKHAASQVFKDIIVRVGERVIFKRTSLRFIQNALSKIGVRLTQRLAGRALSRWLPIVGAIGVGAYAYYDTAQVGQTAIELFGSDMEVERV